ncbi:MAG: hypothetical protein ACE5FG_04500 [Myxococcota bacterium]
MWIHGILAQGLRAPKGEHRLALDRGYNLVLSEDPSEGWALVDLVCALLYPRNELGHLELWRDPDSQKPARAGLTLSFASEVYRIVVDFDRERLALARYRSESGRFERLTLDPDELSATLRRAGLPAQSEFRLLYECRDIAAASRQPERPPRAVSSAPPSRSAQRRAQLEAELHAAEAGRARRRELEERIRELRRSSERLAPLQADRERLRQELERRRVLGEAIEDLEARLEEVNELEARRARERVAIEQARRELLDERSELRGIPARQDFPLWIGVTLMVLGWLAGLLAHPFFYLFGGGGGVSVGAALLVSRAARRRMGKVEASLAELRVREREIERDFERRSASIRGLMQTLGHASLEALAREAADYRGTLARLRDVERQLEEIHAALPDAERDEFAEIESELAQLEKLRDPAQIRAEIARLAPSVPERIRPGADEPADADPDDGPELDALQSTAALMTGRADVEVRERFAPLLPLYLRLLSGGAFQQARRHDSEGWLLRGEQQGDVIPFASLRAGPRAAVQLAFRFALLEAIAPDLSLPLLLGPACPLDDSERMAGLAQALRRLSSAVQVVQIAREKGDWADQAACTLVVRSA